MSSGGSRPAGFEPVPSALTSAISALPASGSFEPLSSTVPPWVAIHSDECTGRQHRGDMGILLAVGARRRQQPSDNSSLR
ncbi:hypothetical protein V502_07376 [Pseudogymnoascus sp. VKM F-4520 (FW-2644)]|nr:hypothetical protein V502_07376 [Pseudogymnoascus sp. VKM F-4520 (FW-2644)]